MITGPEQLPRPQHRQALRRRKFKAIGLVATILAIVVAVAVLAIVNPQASYPPASANPSAEDQAASAAVKAAARAAGFHPTTEPGAGVIETARASAGHPPYTSSLLPIGAVAPNFSLRTPTGQRISLKALRGKVVLLEFFATWCPLCNAEASHLEAAYSSLPPGGRVEFVAVNGDSEGVGPVYAYHRYYGLHYPAVLDPGGKPGSFRLPGTQGTVTTRYGVKRYPTFYIVDPKGRISWRGDAEQPDALIHQELVRAANRQ